MYQLTKPLALAGLLCSIALPGFAASTKAEVQALREEVAGLKAGQQKMQADLAEIRKLLEAGNRPAAAAAPSFQPRDLELGTVASKGNPGGAVTVVEFSDYQCPYCKRHATTVFPQLLEQYGDRVRFTMREFPIENIHPLAFGASLAALCAADQGHYWEMHDALFADQRALNVADLKGHAAAIGLDRATFDTCLDTGQHTERVKAHQAEAASMGITGTPSFVLGLSDPDDPGKVHLTRYIRGAQALPAFQAAIDELLREAAAQN